MAKIFIQVDHLSVSADLKNSPTARKILEILPIEGSANVWGEEIYFDIPLQAELEPDAREEVEVGDLGYWPAGPAFCIFFGPTPVSQGDQPRAYSPVNVFGRVVGDAKQFKTVAGGAKVSVTLAEE
ncbi:MAG: cyclophilin-like fold protein [Desulfobacterales bacterium]|nr:cyclophilin-like fold protein [Desulfobacterales bacterium]